MITKNTVVAVQSLYAQIEAEYNRQIQEYLSQQMTAPLENIKRHMNAVADFCNHKKTAKLHDYIGRIQEDCTAVEQLAEDLTYPFTLFIMGNGKNGKSTLINALLGQQQAAEGIVPKTWKIDIFQERQGTTCTLTFRDGTKKELKYEEAQEFLATEEKNCKESSKAISKKLKDFAASGAPPKELEEKQQELKKYELYKSAVIEASWPVTDSPILEHYRLVDTPGLRQELDDMVYASANEYFSKADGVIWILPGDKINSSGDYNELKQLYAKYEKQPNNLVAVVNRIDLIRQAGKDVDEVVREAQKLYGSMIPDIIPISAKEAREAEAILKQPNVSQEEYDRGQKLLEQSNLKALFDLLNRTFLANSLQLQVQSKTRNCQELYANVRAASMTAIDVLKKMDDERLNKIKNWEKDKSDVLKRLQQDLKNFEQRESERVLQETGKVEDRLWDMDSELRNHYIMATIIRPSQIEKTLEALVQHHCSQLSTVAARHMSLAPFREFPLLKERQLKASASTRNAVDNAALSGDLSDEGTAQFCLGGALAIGAAALLGPVGLIFAGFAVTDIGRSVAKWLSRTFGDSMSVKVKKRLSSQLGTAIQKLSQEYEAYLKRADESIQKVREDTYAELYGPSEQKETIIKDLSQLKETSKLTIKPLLLKDILFSDRRTDHGR